MGRVSFSNCKRRLHVKEVDFLKYYIPRSIYECNEESVLWKPVEIKMWSEMLPNLS